MFEPSALSYELPEGRVAKSYPRRRADVKLMVIDRKTGVVLDRKFRDVLDFIGSDVCYANNAKYSKPLLSDELEREPLYAKGELSSIIPTSGNPFEEWMLAKMDLRFVTLTTPEDERVSTRESYAMFKSNAETFDVQGFYEKEPVTVIGTMAVKALESSYYYGKSRGVSDMLILPGFKFKAVGKLLTNFHYPREILLALTCAFGGTELILDAYKYAMKKDYQISDRGDRMLII